MFHPESSELFLASMLSKAVLINGRSLSIKLTFSSHVTDVISIQENGTEVLIGQSDTGSIKRLITHLVEKRSRPNTRSSYLTDKGEVNLKKPLFNIMFTMPDIVRRFGHPFAISSKPTADANTVEILISIRYSNSFWQSIKHNGAITPFICNAPASAPSV